MRTSIITALTAVILLMAVSAMAGDCNNDKFQGTYTRVDAPSDVYGDGSVMHQYVYQLVLNSDGSAIQYWTGLPDIQINFGTGSINIGSWKCRSDGKLVVNLLAASYSPIGPNANLGTPDTSLTSTTHYTFLFKINNPNQLTRIQSRSRVYSPSADPTDPAGGTLGALNTTQVTYKRFVASDADLTAP